MKWCKCGFGKCSFMSDSVDSEYPPKCRSSLFCEFFESVREDDEDYTDPHEDDEYYLNESEEDIMDRENQFKELYETDLDSILEVEGDIIIVDSKTMMG